MNMHLVFDVGNTNTVIGLFNEVGELVDHWRAATDSFRTGDEWRVLLDSFLAQGEFSSSNAGVRLNSLRDVGGVVIGSVVPSVTGSLERMCARLSIDALVVDYSTPTSLRLAIDHPRELGPDRMANGVAALELGALPAIVVDMGTATTLDVVSHDGAYIGGVIMPGLSISMDALVSRAAALRSVQIAVPYSVIGTSTVKAVQSGATFGVASQIDGLCERIEKEIGPATVYFTGGVSSVIAPISTKCTKHDPWLTLRGFSSIARSQLAASRNEANKNSNPTIATEQQP